MILDNPNNIMFCNANLLENAYSVTASTQTTGYELTKALNYNRQQTWKPTGRFLIDATNNLIYINDGSNKTATVAVSDYATGAALGTAMQTALNAVSSSFTVTYTNNRFTISRGSSFTLRLSQTTNSIAYSIGFTSITDTVTTSASANERRCHYPYEEISIDFGFNLAIDAFIMIGKLTEEFQISQGATINILANNINSFTSPQLSLNAEINDEGAFCFFGNFESAYRYWKIRIQDFQNPLGSSFEISNIYLGQGLFLEYRNVSTGFEFVLNDTTAMSESESGVKYFDENYKFYNFAGLNFAILDPTNKDILLKLFQDQGISRPFYLCVDPGKQISNEISHLNRLMRFSDSPRFQQVFFKYFTVNANFTEHF